MVERMFLIAVLLAAASSSGAAAQDRSEGPEGNVVDAVAACRDIADSGTRLACFDRTAAALVAARDKKDVVVLNREEMQKTRRSLFGFALPRIRLFGADDEKEGGLAEISGRVAVVDKVDIDRWAVRLDDGSIWRTIETSNNRPPEVGNNVLIKRAALGSFLASFNNRRSIRVKRVG